MGKFHRSTHHETFNTLKNQGYEFEHNFGHGYQYLSTVFAYLMFLAFLIDQAQQLCCEFFNRAWQKKKRKTRLWRKIRALFCEWRILSWQDLYESILHDYERGTLTFNTS